jgi:erythromycin esterase-like protein
MRARSVSSYRARALVAPLMLATIVIGLGPGTSSATTCLTGTGQALSPGAGGQFLGVAVSSGRAWAVGDYFYYGRGGRLITRPLIEHWNGTAWKRQPSPSPTGSYNVLFGAAATSASDAWAVGGGSTSQGLIERWNGTTWTQVPSPSPAGATGGTDLQSVAATSASDAWVVGSYNTGTNTAGQTLIEHWNGTTWTQVPSPNPGGSATSIELTGVAATSAADAWAVGQYFNNATRHYQMLIEHWNGTTWMLVPSPSPASPNRNNVLAGVAATSAADAWAVGQYHNNAARQDQTLIEHWNGTTWTQVPSPNPAPSHFTNKLTAVAATSASNAWAVGEYLAGGRPSATLSFAEHWNGTTWTQVATPNPSPGYDVPSGVAATTATNAWAAGVSVTSNSEQPLAFRCR